MKKTTIKQVSETTDVSLASFLLFKGADLKPRKTATGRVAFRVEAEELDGLLDDFFNNPLVPLNDFITNFKIVKSMIYELGGTRK